MKKYIIILFIIIFIVGVYFINTSFARYKKELTSDTMTITSKGYTNISATLTRVDDEENTFSATVTNNNDYDVRYKIKENNDLYNVEYNGSNDGYATILANSTDNISVVFSARNDVVYEDMKTDSQGLLYKEIDIVIEALKPYDSEPIQLAATQKNLFREKCKK